MSLSRSLGILKLDIDRGMTRPSLGSIMQRLRRAGRWPVWLSECRSPGGKGWHIELEVLPRPRSAMEVVALQAILGSDPRREACNVSRARRWREIPAFARPWWNVLYRRVRS